MDKDKAGQYLILTPWCAGQSHKNIQWEPEIIHMRHWTNQEVITEHLPVQLLHLMHITEQ